MEHFVNRGIGIGTEGDDEDKTGAAEAAPEILAAENEGGENITEIYEYRDAERNFICRAKAEFAPQIVIEPGLKAKCRRLVSLVLEKDGTGMPPVDIFARAVLPGTTVLIATERQKNYHAINKKEFGEDFGVKPPYVVGPPLENNIDVAVLLHELGHDKQAKEEGFDYLIDLREQYMIFVDQKFVEKMKQLIGDGLAPEYWAPLEAYVRKQKEIAQISSKDRAAFKLEQWRPANDILREILPLVGITNDTMAGLRHHFDVKSLRIQQGEETEYHQKKSQLKQDLIDKLKQKGFRFGSSEEEAAESKKTEQKRTLLREENFHRLLREFFINVSSADCVWVEEEDISESVRLSMAIVVEEFGQGDIIGVEIYKKDLGQENYNKLLSMVGAWEEAHAKLVALEEKEERLRKEAEELRPLMMPVVELVRVFTERDATRRAFIDMYAIREECKIDLLVKYAVHPDSLMPEMIEKVAPANCVSDVQEEVAKAAQHQEVVLDPKLALQGMLETYGARTSQLLARFKGQVPKLKK